MDRQERMAARGGGSVCRDLLSHRCFTGQQQRVSCFGGNVFISVFSFLSGKPKNVSFSGTVYFVSVVLSDSQSAAVCAGTYR